MTAPICTFQTRLDISEEIEKALDAYVSIHSKVEHSLFKEIMAGRSAAHIKSDYIKRFGITARQFNSCRIQIEGKIESLRQLQSDRIDGLKRSISKLDTDIVKLSKKKKDAAKLHYKKRQKNKFQQNLSKYQEDQKNNIVPLCFGTKKLFRAQFHLEESGYKTFEEWKSSWKKSRNSEFFVVGSKDETSGNQTCSAMIQEDGKFTIRLRLPDALHSEFGKYQTLKDVEFAYGHERIIASLHDCEERNRHKKNKHLIYKEFGQAISYRFKRDEKGWRIFASTTLNEPEWVTTSCNGVIGVDINSDHLAVVETDRYGNPIASINIPVVLYGKDKNQSQSIIGDACAQVVAMAIQKKKDLVIEKIDFKKKRAELCERGQALARTFSSFAYRKIIQGLTSRSFRYGVHIHQVNPAYTSIIGQVKFAKRYGLTTHQAAALCIGRRYYGYSERPSCYQDKVPDGKGGHVAFSLPVRNGRKHVWSQWRVIKKEFQAVHAAHLRTVKRRSTDPPMSQSVG